MDKIGVGIVTCDRDNFLEKCIDSLPKFDGPLVIVNDGKIDITNRIRKIKTTHKLHLIQHKENKGVGISKNDAMQYLLEQGVEHIFLLEDDIIILKEDVFKKYIEASKISGILHFNYGPGSPFNRKQDQNILWDLHNRHLCDQHSEPNPKKIIDYGNNIKISLFEHTVAMFSYFHKKVLEEVGLHDEQFYNAWEHVDLTYRIIKAGYHPPFWWFADIFNSHEYLTEAPGAIDNSSIANKQEQWAKNVYGGREKYKIKHGHYPNALPYVVQGKEIDKYVIELKEKHATEKSTYSQYGQDLFVLKALNYKKEGVFIEAGAYDGIDCSNTYLLEKKYNWRGVCVEPCTETFVKLSENRECTLVCCPISDTSNKTVLFKDNFGWSHITNSKEEKTVEKTTISLNDLIKKNNLPSVIDYLSLDVEGEEYNILKTFDFKKYRFNVITVEHNAHLKGDVEKNKIRSLLESNGYKFIKTNKRSSLKPNDWPENIDDFYIHEEILNANN